MNVGLNITNQFMTRTIVLTPSKKNLWKFGFKSGSLDMIKFQLINFEYVFVHLYATLFVNFGFIVQAFEGPS